RGVHRPALASRRDHRGGPHRFHRRTVHGRLRDLRDRAGHGGDRTHWSTFGLTVIMIAIKLGGLGLMTVASLLSLSVMHRLGLAQRMITAQETRAERLAEVGGV